MIDYKLRFLLCVIALVFAIASFICIDEMLTLCWQQLNLKSTQKVLFYSFWFTNSILLGYCVGRLPNALNLRTSSED